MDSNIKILVVDDFSTMRRIVNNLLHELGFDNIEEAENGRTALLMLRAGGFNFVVTGRDMPGMSGIDLLKKIREDKELNSIPVLMVSAEAQRAKIIEAIEAGVNDYIVKPFTALTLKDKIEKIFEREEA